MRKHAFAMVGVSLAAAASLGLGGVAHAQTTVVTPAAPVPSPPQPVVVQPPPQEPARVEVHTPAAAPAPQPVVVDNSGAETNRHLLRSSRALIASGVTLFGVTYLSTVIAAAVTSDVCAADASLGCREAAWPIYIPVVGPFVQMGYVSGTGANTARALLAIDGVLQGGGIAMAVAGIVMGTAAASSGSRPAYSRFLMTPGTVGSGSGLVAMGRF